MFRSRFSVAARLLTVLTLGCLVGCPPRTLPCKTEVDCDDHDACTVDACGEDGRCDNTDVDCDDGDPCTTDFCDAATGCVNDPIVCPEGEQCMDSECVPIVECDRDADCDDGDLCTDDTCVEEVCTFTAIVCDDDDPCTDDLCDPETGGCVCGAGFTCMDGSCVSRPPECDEQSSTYTYQDFEYGREDVCTEEDNWCGWADQPGKAVVYGEMSTVVQVPDSCEKLDVTIFIPCNGWGEGLKGPDGSSAHIIVNGVVREEPIDDTLDYHHEAYYRYESCESFVNTFDVAGEAQAELIIRMNGGASMDFQQATLRFY